MHVLAQPEEAKESEMAVSVFRMRCNELIDICDTLSTADVIKRGLPVSVGDQVTWRCICDPAWRIIEIERK